MLKVTDRQVVVVIGVTLLTLYELLLDGSGIGMKERWNKLKDWSEG